VSKKRIPVRTTQPNPKPQSSEPVSGNPASDAPADGAPKERAETAPGSGAAAAPDAELARLRAEIDEAKDRALRCQAELENYRRRVAREMEQERRYAALPLLRDLLPVWDNVHRAIEAAEQAGGDPGLVRGFQMVAEQIEGVLRNHECVKIEALHQPFDPNLHEAITQQPSDQHPPGTVVGETQTGFRLHDRVVRPSQVIVSLAATANDDDRQGNPS